jgi:hypothetical protein
MATSAAAEAKRRAVAKASTAATQKAAKKNPVVETALDVIPGARFLANTGQVLSGNKVSPANMQAGYLGLVGGIGAARAVAGAGKAVTSSILKKNAAEVAGGPIPKTLFHGTNVPLKPGQVVEPRFGSASATGDINIAKQYSNIPGGTPTVLKVQPRGNATNLGNTFGKEINDPMGFNVIGKVGPIEQKLRSVKQNAINALLERQGILTPQHLNSRFGPSVIKPKTARQIKLEKEKAAKEYRQWLKDNPQGPEVEG